MNFSRLFSWATSFNRSRTRKKDRDKEGVHRERDRVLCCSVTGPRFLEPFVHQPQIPAGEVLLDYRGLWEICQIHYKHQQQDGTWH